MSATATLSQAPHIVYFSYGEGPHVAQITFSALSAMRFARPPAIAVYTDRPERYEGLGVECVPFSADELRAWRGPLEFTHVAKLEVLRLALARFGAPCALVDGDSYFRRDPSRLLARIARGRSVMHLRECRLGQFPSAELRERVIGHHFEGLDGGQVSLGAEVELWNAGVIGLHPDDAALLGEAIHLTHQVYERTRSVVAEQLSVSFVLSSNTRVRGCAEVLYHYWPYLRDWDPPHDPTDWARRVPELLAETAALEPVERGRALVAGAYRLPFWGRRGRLYWRVRPLLERAGVLEPDVRRSA